MCQRTDFVSDKLNLAFGASFLFLVFWFCGKLRNFRTAQKHVQKTVEYACEPPKTLTGSRLYLGLDAVQEMFQTYYSGTRNRQLQQRFHELGITYRLQSLGTARVYTMDPVNVKAAFSGNTDDWGVEPIRLKAFEPLIGAGVLVTDGHRWSQARTLCQVTVDGIYRTHRKNLSAFDMNIDLLLNQIPSDGRTVDMRPFFNQYMIDSATTYIFGESVGALKPGPAGSEGKAFMNAFLVAIKIAGARDELPLWAQLPLDYKLRKSSRIVHEVADRYVRKALNQCTSSGEMEPEIANLAAGWAKLTKEPSEIRNQILNVLVAAFDTISITLTHALFHLARSPERYSKLRNEVIESDIPQHGDDLRSLPYLQDVIKETMRISTAATFNSRVALKDNILPRGGGPNGDAPILVPKGHIVICSIYALQRRPEAFGPDAHLFHPERWSSIKPKHWDFIPFSAGTRVCPGMKLAGIQTAYALYSFVRRFSRIENRDPVYDFVEEYKVSTASKNGAKIALFVN